MRKNALTAEQFAAIVKLTGMHKASATAAALRSVFVDGSRPVDAAARTGAIGVRFTSADGPSPTADLSETPLSSSLGHGVPALDAELRERVFDHRAAVIQAENQILYLQDYARLCAAGAAP